MLMDVLKMVVAFILSGFAVYLLTALISSAVSRYHKAKRAQKGERSLDALKAIGKGLDFSKVMLLIQTGMSVLLVIVSVAIKIRLQMDVSDLLSIATASFAMDGAWGGFYLWKAKNENRAKYAQQFVLDFADKYGPDIAIQLAQVVLRD